MSSPGIRCRESGLTRGADYYPRPDRKLYPRKNIRFADEDELRRGWAWRAEVIKDYSVANARQKEDDSSAADGRQANSSKGKAQASAQEEEDGPTVVSKGAHEDVTRPHQIARLPRSDVDADPASMRPIANEATAPIEKKTATSSSSGKGQADGKAIDNERKQRGEGDKLLLEGKTVVLKDMIMLADVPCLFGSETGGEYVCESRCEVSLTDADLGRFLCSGDGCNMRNEDPRQRRSYHG